MLTTVGSPFETLAKKEETLSFSGEYKKIRKEMKDPANTSYIEVKTGQKNCVITTKIQQMFYTDWPTRQLTDNTVLH